jgi:uncharacterized protein YigE (DUF2233 family)
LALSFAGAAEAGTCRDITFEDLSYTVCEAKAGEDVRLFLKDSGDRMFGSFRAVNAQLAETGQTLGFAMNAGMYHDDRRPVGYFVEEGQELAVLQRQPGPGNFGLHPNGVFCVAQDGFAVIETLAFDAARPDCRFASQSGPMLVLSGALHPKFLPDSDSLNIRNGVGVTRDGSAAYFVISNDPVNFHAFARFFRDGLGTPDALFFDGTISRIYAPEIGRDDFGLPMGPIVGLVVPAE